MFTQQELIILLRFCDMAVRQGGLEVANVAVPLSQKITQLSQQMQMPQHRQAGNGALMHSFAPPPAPQPDQVEGLNEARQQ